MGPTIVSALSDWSAAERRLRHQGWGDKKPPSTSRFEAVSEFAVEGVLLETRVLRVLKGVQPIKLKVPAPFSDRMGPQAVGHR